MSSSVDLAVYAEALISAVARAFYDDTTVMLLDVLIRDKYLRDDDMAPRLTLSAKKLRAALQFLTDEHLVNSETVDDLAQGGSQATKFYYIDYNRAVHSIRLRVYLLRKRLVAAELRARSSSVYLCPGYSQQRCNGKYTEQEAQQVVDYQSGLFLCPECTRLFENDPDPPARSVYTLQLVDNSKELSTAVDQLRRFNVQLSTKMVGNSQIRPGIYDLLQTVRPAKKSSASMATSAPPPPITSNLPSENFALGIGSQRLAGTGRTAGIKAKKLEQQGVAVSAAVAQQYLVGGADENGQQYSAAERMFLKNAMGHEIMLAVERGGGARAQLLANSNQRRRRRKLMEAAASRIGASLPVTVQAQEMREQREEAKKKKQKKNSKTKDDDERDAPVHAPLEFLNDNIGRSKDRKANNDAPTPANLVSTQEVDSDDDDDESGNDDLVLLVDDDLEELRQLAPDKRHLFFQTQYKLQVNRQRELLDMPRADGKRGSFVDDDGERSVIWEDGEVCD